jgi:fructose-1,6-bisphosphatase/inositol monophosphatase family enzyme
MLRISIVPLNPSKAWENRAFFIPFVGILMPAQSQRLDHDPDVLLRETKNACDAVQNDVIRIMKNAPRTAAIGIPNEFKPKNNPSRVFDRIAEECFTEFIKPKFVEPLTVMGEEDESLPTADFRNHTCTVFLIDAIDGSDLIMADIGNWCSAAVCFSPPLHQILLAVIAHSNGQKYWAKVNTPGACMERRIIPSKSKQKVEWEQIPLRIKERVRNLSVAKVCYYGQKGATILVPDEHFCTALGDLGRIYNLAGNPMMVRLAEGKIDAVFDLRGQYAHDVVPGAYIALKAGASMCTPENEPIDEVYLFNKLLQPSQKIRYILAGTSELRDELCARLANVKMMGDILEAPPKT